MTRSRTSRLAWTGALLAGLMCACGVFSAGSPSASGDSAPANFPLTPNPLDVQITLDAQHKISSQGQQAGVIGQETLYGKDAKGNSLDVIFPGDFLTQGSDGTYDSAFGTPVTATPVSAIGGIPFAKGFVAAFQFGPEGLLMSQPVTVSMDVQGNYTDLVGFASNGDGTDFHLIPISAGPLGSSGQTSVTFDLMHFSMYGVAEATAAEVAAQQAHPPSSPADQDDDLLAAPKSKKQVLTEEHDQLVKSMQSRGTCNDVITAARSYLKWYGQVQSAGLQDTFKSTIAADTNTLLKWLKDCIKDSCPACLAPSQGQNNSQTLKQRQAAAKAVMIQANFIEAFDLMQTNASDANYYRDLASKCAKNAGLKDPSPHVAECQGSQCQKVTPTELACPAP